MVRPELILLGYWSKGVGSRWPSPASFVDADWDPDERELVVEYLCRGFVARTYMGYSLCRVCGQQNGALELSDGVFVWPDGFAHYVSDHLVKPPQEFVDHALAALASIEEADRNEQWWTNLSLSSQSAFSHDAGAGGHVHSIAVVSPCTYDGGERVDTHLRSAVKYAR